MSKTSIFAPLQHRPYRMLFAGQLFSDLGTWLDMLALGILVAYTWNMGAAELAALTIVMGVPWVVIGPFAAVWADRLPRKGLMIFCDFLRMLIVLGFVVAPNLYVLLALVFLKELFSAMFDPARQGAIRTLVPEAVLLQASSLSQLSLNVTKVAAPVFGGVIIAASSPSFVFLLEAALFLGSMLFLMRLPHMPKAIGEEASEEKAGQQESAFWKQFREGLRFIGANRVLATAITLMAVRFFLIFLYDGLLVLWGKEVGMPEEYFGIFLGAVGLGTVLGTLVVGQWSFWSARPIRMMAVTGAVSGIAILTLALGSFHLIPSHPAMWVALFFAVGFIGAGSAVPYGFVLQKETPSNIIGRVTGAANSISNLSMFAAPALGAVVAEWIGTGGVFAIAGTGTILTGLVALLAVRHVEGKRNHADQVDGLPG
ncbi:putative MFS family arabinose efflux permease [Tumebacillus sp. BK434]|uniref:MFS transporter n=1 Tax=Tumebacillus sp. BK434 TaxID=2512169 RepID=UPI00104AFE43|nr:MFS transporter [Tumebacillus sp. BK434]TCP54744.1 putative MFS family arabinose efflux permease [Tumebacillus sp. BK434]